MRTEKHNESFSLQKLIGVIIFSGSLYVLSFTKIGVLGAITPIGGVSFIVAWILMIVAAVKYL